MYVFTTTDNYKSIQTVQTSVKAVEETYPGNLQNLMEIPRPKRHFWWNFHEDPNSFFQKNKPYCWKMPYWKILHNPRSESRHVWLSKFNENSPVHRHWHICLNIFSKFPSV